MRGLESAAKIEAKLIDKLLASPQGLHFSVIRNITGIGNQATLMNVIDKLREKGIVEKVKDGSRSLWRLKV